MELAQWRKHIDQAVHDDGQWVGLLDEDGYPMMDFPAIVTVTAPKARSESSSVEIVVDVNAGGGRRLLDELVADGIGDTDAEKRLVPASGSTRLVCIVRPGGRLVYTVTHSVVEGRAAPSLLRINGVDLLDGLSWWPAPSVPRTWAEAEFRTMTTDASGAEYATPRDLAQVEFAQVADGYTVKDHAVTAIRKVIQDSFDATNQLMGWDDPHAVVDYSGGEDNSPELLIRTDDSSIWDTVAEPAMQSGVTLAVGLWWPGDIPVTVRDGDSTTRREWDYPIQVVRVSTARKAE